MKSAAQTSDWFSVRAGFWRSLWLVLRGGRLREWKWLTEDEVRASGVYLSDEEFFASLEWRRADRGPMGGPVA